MEKIREELTALFDEMLDHLNAFRKKSYAKTFEEAFQKHKGTITEIARMLSEVSEEEKDALIEELAAIIPDYAYEKIQGKSKSQKERLSVDYNMNMAVYVVPMLGYIHDENCDALGKKMVETWNKKHVTTLRLSYATYDEISGGFKSRLCFITTAVCDSKQKPDDCYELTTLRAYRDDYMMQSEEGRRMVEEYYDVAPGLVQVINMQNNASEIYEDIYKSYLMPCVHLIENKENEACRDLYEEMVRELEKTYLHRRNTA